MHALFAAVYLFPSEKMGKYLFWQCCRNGRGELREGKGRGMSFISCGPPSAKAISLRVAQVDLRHIDEELGRDRVEIGVDLTEFYMSVEWDILEVPAIRNVKFYTCCDEPYLDITFNVTMRRKTLFYTVNLIIPCMGISFLTVLVFYLPSDSGEKVKKRLIFKGEMPSFLSRSLLPTPTLPFRPSSVGARAITRILRQPISPSTSDVDAGEARQGESDTFAPVCVHGPFSADEGWPEKRLDASQARRLEVLLVPPVSEPDDEVGGRRPFCVHLPFGP